MLPFDWERARKLEPQADEPWRKPNLREGDMLLPAENGWLGDIAHGEDKSSAQSCRGHDEHRTAELRETLNKWMAETGMDGRAASPCVWRESHIR